MELQRDLNDIFHVPEERVQGVVASIRKRAIGFLWVFGVGLALTAVWLLNAVWRFFGDEILPAGAENLHFVVGLLTPLVSVVLLPVIFGLFLQTMTAVRIRWRAIWWGSLFTSVAFLAAAYGVGLYFSWDSETSASQVAASLFVVLLLAFVLATVFFLGAEVTKVYDDYLDHGDVKAPSERLRHVPEAVVSQPEPAMPMAAVFGFLGGLFVGWRRRS
jgi:membrane protein